MNDLSGPFALIAATWPPSAWPSLEKCQTLAAMVFALRPTTIVEIGVWTGDSLLPQLFALRELGGERIAWAIDPWSNDASVEGQEGANADWWGQVNHQTAFETFMGRLRRHDVEKITHVVRAKSDEVDPMPIGEIGILHVDGNHAAQAIRDVERFAPSVPIGGMLVMDDLGWEGGAVRRAYDHARELGFVELYPLGTGCVMQRREAK
jgi:hypothetical protein